MLFLVASAACGAATNVVMLVAARVPQAIGAALLTPSSLASCSAPSRRAARHRGQPLGCVGGLAAALGPSVGSGVVDALGWRWAFFLNLPLGLLAWWRGRRRLTEWRSADHDAPLDVPGIVLLIAGVGALAFGIVQSEALGWRSRTVLGSMAAGFVAMLIFVGWARRAPHPAVDLRCSRTDLSLREPGDLRLRLRLRDDVLRLVLLLDAGPALLAAEGGTGSDAGAAARRARGDHRGAFRGTCRPPALARGRRTALRRRRPVALARAGTQPDFLGIWVPGLVLTGTAVGMVLPSLSGAAVARLRRAASASAAR